MNFPMSHKGFLKNIMVIGLAMIIFTSLGFVSIKAYLFLFSVDFFLIPCVQRASSINHLMPEDLSFSGYFIVYDDNILLWYPIVASLPNYFHVFLHHFPVYTASISEVHDRLLEL